MTHFSVILADPPWRYSAWKGDRGMRTAESFYATLTLEQLSDMRPMIDQWAAKDCALFLWSTPPAQKEALRLLEAWEFTYKTFAFTWIKTTKNGGLFFGMGHYTRANAEMCLLATRGKPKVQARDVRQVIMARGGNIRVSPTSNTSGSSGCMAVLTWIFARQRREGWDVWGDEAQR